MIGSRSFVAGLLLLGACGHGKHPGFKQVADDVYLSYHVLGDGGTLVQDDDSVHLVLRMAVEGASPGSLLSTQRWYAGADLRTGAFIPVLARLYAGDSVSVITSAVSLPWEVLAPHGVPPPPGATEVRMELTLLEVRTPAMVRAGQERHRLADPEGFEHGSIMAYMERSGHVWERWGTSMLHYRIAGVPVDTARVRAGDVVHVSWRGSRVEDGAPIDDTRRNGGPFVFRYGDTDQVIKGVETAVMLLREGQEGTFIIPSTLAFGARGVEGLVGPWSPVVYVVRLEGVERS